MTFKTQDSAIQKSEPFHLAASFLSLAFLRHADQMVLILDIKDSILWYLRAKRN